MRTPFALQGYPSEADSGQTPGAKLQTALTRGLEDETRLLGYVTLELCRGYMGVLLRIIGNLLKPRDPNLNHQKLLHPKL